MRLNVRGLAGVKPLRICRRKSEALFDRMNGSCGCTLPRFRMADSIAVKLFSVNRCTSVRVIQSHGIDFCLALLISTTDFDSRLIPSTDHTHRGFEWLPMPVDNLSCDCMAWMPRHVASLSSSTLVHALTRLGVLIFAVLDSQSQGLDSGPPVRLMRRLPMTAHLQHSSLPHASSFQRSPRWPGNGRRRHGFVCKQ
jgi:hypothetical protein